MTHLTNPNGLRFISVPIFCYLFYYTLTNEPPWPKWLIGLAFLASYLSYSSYRAEKKLNCHENESNKPHDSGFNFEINDFSKHQKHDDLRRNEET